MIRADCHYESGRRGCDDVRSAGYVGPSTKEDQGTLEMYRPTSLRETLQIVGEHPNALLLAGGTDVMVEINLRHRRPEVVVSLRRVGELMESGKRFIGSGVTYATLEGSPHPALAEAARTVGSPQIRAMGTIGGNLGTASPAGDALPFLVAAEATVLLASAEDTRRLPIEEFLVGPKRNALLPGEVIVGVELDDGVPRAQAFSKVGVRQAMVIAMVSACVLREEDGATRVAIGAVGPKVLRARAAEDLVIGAPLGTEVLEEFQALVSQASRPIDDHRGTADYRRHAVGVVARRCLERVTAP